MAGEREVELRLRTGDPFSARRGRAARRGRSVEARLARDLLDQDEWAVVGEPDPIPAGSSFLFPEFELVSRPDASHRWFIEIVGFWTPEYLDDKRAAYREAGIDTLILCVDDRLRCAEEARPRGDTSSGTAARFLSRRSGGSSAAARRALATGETIVMVDGVRSRAGPAIQAATGRSVRSDPLAGAHAERSAQGGGRAGAELDRRARATRSRRTPAAAGRIRR